VVKIDDLLRTFAEASPALYCPQSTCIPRFLLRDVSS